MLRTGLFGDAVESFAQQFSAAQKQTEAIKHIMRRRKPAASTPAAVPQPAHQDIVSSTPSPGGGPGGESFVSFCFCSAAGPEASGTQNFNKRAVSSVSGSQEEESCELCITGLLPSSSLAIGQKWVAQEHPSCPFVEPGKGCNTRVPASCCHTPGCHKPQAGFQRFLQHEEESGECYISHPDSAPCRHSPGPGPCVPPRCPTAGTSVAPLVPLARSLGAWLARPSPSRWLLRTIRLGYAIQFARRPPKFRGIRFT